MPSRREAASADAASEMAVASASVRLSIPSRAAADPIAAEMRVRRRQSSAVGMTTAGAWASTGALPPADQFLGQELRDDAAGLLLLRRIEVLGHQAVQLHRRVLVDALELRQEERVEDLVQQARLGDVVAASPGDVAPGVDEDRGAEVVQRAQGQEPLDDLAVALEQLLVGPLGRGRHLDEREAPHQGVRHVEQEVLVERVHRGDDPPRRREPDRIGVAGGLDPVGHEGDRLDLAAAPEGQHDRGAGQDGEQLAEGPVEVGPVELVDDEPLAGLDRLDEEAGPEDQALGGGLQAADRLERRPLGRGGRRLGPGAEHGGAPQLCPAGGERGLAGAGRAREDHVLAGVERGDELVDDEGREDHPLLLGDPEEFWRGERCHPRQIGAWDPRLEITVGPGRLSASGRRGAAAR